MTGRCGASFDGKAHTAWAAQGYTAQPHTCDRELGHSGAHTCFDEKDNPISEVGFESL